MAEGAAPTRTSEPDIAALGRRFSAPVRSVAARLADEEVAAAQIADALLRDDRDYGGEGLLPLQAREGERASVGRWLLRMAGLFDEEAVAQGPPRSSTGGWPFWPSRGWTPAWTGCSGAPASGGGCAGS